MFSYEGNDATFTSIYDLLCPSTLLPSTHRERFSPNCERGVHTAHVILCQIRKMTKQPIMCFESSFPEIRWSSVSLPVVPP